MSILHSTRVTLEPEGLHHLAKQTFTFNEQSELQRKREKCIIWSTICINSISILKRNTINTSLPKYMNLSLNRTSWVHLFTCKRFHVLLNSLFKVLCNFPSRYLFAIGLTVVFSLRWSLPSNLGCTLKQPDSIINYTMHDQGYARGLAPSLVGITLFKRIHETL
jgi:hypothetical protein